MAKNRIITMTQNEVNRCEISRMANERKITQKAGAGRIGVTERHFRRLLSQYRRQGPEGFISRYRGKQSNNRTAEKKKDRILKKLCEEYQVFRPTLASEKLAQRDGLEVRKEAVRQIMIQAGLHQPKSRKRDRTNFLRERRKRRGELVQMDGSYHAWLEDQAEKACLL